MLSIYLSKLDHPPVFSNPPPPPFPRDSSTPNTIDKFSCKKNDLTFQPPIFFFCSPLQPFHKKQPPCHLPPRNNTEPRQIIMIMNTYCTADFRCVYRRTRGTSTHACTDDAMPAGRNGPVKYSYGLGGARCIRFNNGYDSRTITPKPATINILRSIRKGHLYI